LSEFPAICLSSNQFTGILLETRFLIFQVVIILPFLIGSILSGRLKSLPNTAKKVISVNLTIFEPPIILWSIWGLTLTLEMAFLPLAGVFLVILGFLLGSIVIRFMSLKKPSAKVYVICSSLANHGFTMGGFLCYLFAGEQGLALSAIFLAYFIPYTFLFIFPYAGIQQKSEIFKWRFVMDFLFTRRNLPIYAVFSALLIKSMGIERPQVFFPLDILLIISVSLYYFTLGINFKISDLNPLGWKQLLLAIQKFVILPTITYLALRQFGFSNEIKLVILLQSFMPVAIYAVIAAVMFDLDTRLASSLFVVNSVFFLAVVLPILFLTKDLLF